MIRSGRGPKIIVLAAGCAAAVTAATALPALARAEHSAAGSTAAASTGICTSAKHPKLAARISRGVSSALAARPDSTVGLTVSDAAEDLTCSLHPAWHFISASVIKVTIISALLLKKGGVSKLTTAQHNLAWQMITQSDDDAATDLWDEVGLTAMQKFLDRAGMTHTQLNDAWGLTKLTAHDEMTLLHLLTTKGTVLSNASRGYVLYLMEHVIPSQRWGVPYGAPSGVTVHVKNGWLPYPDTNLSADDWHINSIGAFTGKNIAYQIVVLTEPRGAQSEGYGITTIEDAALVINRDLAKA